MAAEVCWQLDLGAVGLQIHPTVHGAFSPAEPELYRGYEASSRVGSAERACSSGSASSAARAASKRSAVAIW